MTSDNRFYPDAEDPIERVGRGLFGSSVRFKVLIWLGRRVEPEFYADQYFYETGEYSNLCQTIKRLEALGMVEKTDPVTSDNRVQWYRRKSSPLWRIVLASDDALQELQGHQVRVERAKLDDVRDDLLTVLGRLAG